MKPIFQTQFEEEFLISDKLRVKILAGFFLFALLYASINYLNISDSATDEVRLSMKISWSFLLGMALFESGAILFVSWQIKKNFTAIPLWHQYLNSFVEISTPTFILAVLASNISVPYIVVNSPIVSLYYIFIILSILRLDYKISLFITIVAALEYFILGIIVMQGSELRTIDQLPNSYVATNAKVLGLLLSGLGASFIARQIRKKIDRLLVGAEKESRIVNLFGQQVSKEIVKEMLEINGKIPSKLMRVCVMFIDIRDFTVYARGKSPGEVVEYQNAFFSIIINAVMKHGGIINQFLGDGCMITFGAPAPLNNPCQNAVNAAFEIKEELINHVEKNLIPKTTIGVGIHVGEAVTGNIGTEHRQQYCITGNVVILAARIEQLNKEYKSQILTSAEVMKEIKDSPLGFEHLGGVNLKGWHEPVGIYKLA